jgi:5-methylcytosine-specific restriction endonuclease McrA
MRGGQTHVTFRGNVPHRDTLLLDQGFQPLEVIPWQRALVMQLVGKVELVSPHDWHVHTVTKSFPAPGVVRLLRRILHRPPLVRFSRENVYLRDEYSCQYCGVQYAHRELTLDHVLPRSRGGATSWRNVVAACGPCNRRKGQLTPDEAKMPLRTVPTRPHWLAPRVLQLGQHPVPAVWIDWLH